VFLAEKHSQTAVKYDDHLTFHNTLIFPLYDDLSI